MSKKMMKRSLALSALMAFVITGSAMAAELVKYEGTGTESRLTNVSYDGNGSDLTLSRGDNAHAVGGQNQITNLVNFDKIVFDGSYTSGFLSNNDKSSITLGAVDSEGNVIDRIGNITQKEGSYVDIFFSPQYGGNIEVYADNIEMKNVGNAVYGQSGANLLIDVTDTVEFATTYNCTLVGSANLNENTIDKQNTVTINANTLKLNAENGTALGVTSYAWNSGEPPYEDLTGKNLLAVNVSSLIVDARVAASVKNGTQVGNALLDIDADTIDFTAKEYGIYAGNKGKAEIDANTVNIVADNEGSNVYGIRAENNSQVNINANKTTITTVNESGLSYGIDARSGSSVSLTGGLVIDATGNDDYAAGIYSVNNGDITLGAADNKSDITIKSTCVDVNGNQDAGWDNAYGVYAYSHTTNGNNGEVKIFADKLNITVDGAYAYGVMSCSNVDTKEGKSSVVIDANKTKITVTSDVDGNAAAMTAFSGSELIVKGDLEATADNVVLTRGNATVKINESAKNTVNLTGDILFERAKEGSDAEIDANVLVNLAGKESAFKGNILVKNGAKEEISGMKLGLFDGATWTVTDNSFVNNLTANEGKIAFADNGHVDVDAGSGSLVLTEDGKTADDLNDAAGLTTVAQRLGVSKEATETISAKVVMAEGDIKGETTGVVTFVASAEDESNDEVTEGVARVITAEGNIDDYYHGEVTEVTEKVNTKNQAIGDAGISLKLHWRAHMNDMNKRMGELRNAEGEHGVWARMVRGESEYKNTKAQYNQYQLGYDEKLSVDKRWTVGAAVTFADGDASYGQGTTEDKSTAFAIYGSKLNNDGTFVDLIARYAHLESDMEDANSGKGDYATNGMSVSAEFGKRIQHGNGLWVEPQVELTYGTIDSAEFKFDSGKAVQGGDMDSLIGRVGFSLGKDIKQGNVYARASYLYDFDGETETTFGKNGVTRTIKEDLGGGWWEVGVGANINLSKATYIYADVEKTFGGEVDTNWQWNLGVRYSF